MKQLFLLTFLIAFCNATLPACLISYATDPTNPVFITSSEDFGNSIHRIPQYVCQPTSINDIVQTVQFASQNGLRIAVRGQGHNLYGGAQTYDIVVDMVNMNTVTEISSNYVTVQTGARVRDLLAVTFAQSPPTSIPVLPDIMDLSIGGMLSLGGLGFTSTRHGAVVDTVLELVVVTGTGSIVTCSATSNSNLFNTVRSSLGQIGIIVTAKFPLFNVPQNVRYYRLIYSDLARYWSDLQASLDPYRQVNGSQGYLSGNTLEDLIINIDTSVIAAGVTGPIGTDPWLYIMEMITYWDDVAPNDTVVLQGMAPYLSLPIDVSYSDFQFRVDPTIEFLEFLGNYYDPNHWPIMFIPLNGDALEVVNNTVHTFDPADPTVERVSVYPYNDAAFTAPMFSVPTGNSVLFGALRSADSTTAEAGAPVWEQDRAIFNQDLQFYSNCLSLGSNVYTYAMDYIPYSWPRHFGNQWNTLRAAKATYDPLDVLGAGRDIFPSGSPVTCSHNAQCKQQGATTDINYAFCGSGLCDCAPTFQGSGTVQDPCTCKKDGVVWYRGTPYCLSNGQCVADYNGPNCNGRCTNIVNGIGQCAN